MVVLSKANPQVKQLRAAFAGRARLASGLVAIEGDHLLEEAVRSGLILKTVFVSQRREVPAFVPSGIEVVRLASEVFASCVETQSPQGIAALLVPPLPQLEKMLGKNPLLVIAVGLQDPGNLGTLIRSAEAFGANGVLTTAGTVSAWNGKTVRASVGSVFRVPLAPATTEAMHRLKELGVCLFAAVKDGGIPIDAPQLHANLRGGCAILIGNEGAGLDADWLARADRRVSIACAGQVESLNAGIAGSILLYEIARQRRGR